MSKIRALVFYLPQFHPVPENDEWWGKGFTEWTNVTRSKPLFKGHYQPNLPSDLGFYDLRIPEVREQQAQLAREAGIEGFCYWHYWFGNGKRLLERPFNEVVESGKPDFPFCLSWANETWTGVWHGTNDLILIEQKYYGKDDYVAHFYSVLKAFKDARYINVDGKPLFIVYHPESLTEPLEFTTIWRNLAQKEGLKGLYLLGMENEGWDFKKNGFDGRLEWTATNLLESYKEKTNLKFERRLLNIIWRKLTNSTFPLFKKPFSEKPTIYNYPEAVKSYPVQLFEKGNYPTIISNWDNTPRTGTNGMIFLNDSPEEYGIWLRKAINRIKHFQPSERFIFIKSWNEWAEGNYLEPSVKYGKRYLEITRMILDEYSKGSN